MLGLDKWQFALLIALTLLSLNYLTLVALDHLATPTPIKTNLSHEGFTSDQASSSTDIVLANDDLYDDFYASVYDKLTQLHVHTSAKVQLIMKRWTKDIPAKDMRILDGGTGTGVAAIAFAKLGVGEVIGLDNSASMLRQARNVVLPASTLTDAQKENLEWREGNLLDSSALSPSEVNCAVLLYFTVYYCRDLDALFRNLGLWIAPGGHLVVDVVNRHRFDPILSSASPFAGFSLQKYSEKRLTKSRVTFDKFDYEANFSLIGDTGAEFNETFAFKDGTRRRQQHTFNMPDIKKIVAAATYAGWNYKAYLDTTAIGFEYGYLLFFTH